MSDGDAAAAMPAPWRRRLLVEEWWPVGATVAIFAFYALASWLLTGELAGIQGNLTTRPGFTEVAAPHDSHPLGSIDLQFTLYWFAGALFAGLVSLVLGGWSIALLWRHAATERRGFLMIVLALLSALGVYLSIDSPGGLIAFPRALTCADPALIQVHRAFLCQDTLQPGALALLFGDGGWVRNVLRGKLFLNSLFQIAATAIILAALVVARCPGAGLASDEGRAARNAVLLKLFAMGAAVLCLRNGTEILFANWPIAVIKQDGDADATATLTALLGAYIFIYGVLGALVLALGMVAARMLGGPMAFGGDPTVERWIGRIGGWVIRDSTLKTLLALSPIFTATAGAFTTLGARA